MAHGAMGGHHLILILVYDWVHYADENLLFQKYGN